MESKKSDIEAQDVKRQDVGNVEIQKADIPDGSVPLQEADQQIVAPVQPETCAQIASPVSPRVRQQKPTHLSPEVRQRMSPAVSPRVRQWIPTNTSPGFSPLDSIPIHKNVRQQRNISLKSMVNWHQYTSTRTQQRTVSSQDTIPQRPIKAEQKSSLKAVAQAGAISEQQTGPGRHSQTVEFKTKGTQRNYPVVADLKTKKRRSASEQKCSTQKALTSGITRRNSVGNIQASGNTSFTCVEFKGRGKKGIVADLKGPRKMSSSTTAVDVLEGKCNEGLGDKAERRLDSSEKIQESMKKRGSITGKEHSGTKRGLITIQPEDPFETPRTTSEEAQDDVTESRSSTNVGVTKEKSTPKGKESRIPSLFSPKNKSFRKGSVKERTPKDKCPKNIIQSIHTLIHETPTKQPVAQPLRLKLMDTKKIEHAPSGPAASKCSQCRSQPGGSSLAVLNLELSVIICVVALTTLIIMRIAQGVRKREKE